jgi:cell division initiation protein
MMDPRDIEEKQFRVTRIKEGYNQDEVDDFLDLVAAELRACQQELAKVQEENAVLRRRPTEAPTVATPQPPSVMAEKLLAAAEEAARSYEAEAKVRADEIVREAGAQGARVVEEAQSAAEKIKSDGLAEKYRRNEELDRKYAEVSGLVDGLTRRARELRSGLKTALVDLDKGLADER